MLKSFIVHHLRPQHNLHWNNISLSGKVILIQDSNASLASTSSAEKTVSDVITWPTCEYISHVTGCHEYTLFHDLIGQVEQEDLKPDGRTFFFSFFLSLWWAKAQMFFEDLQVDLPHVWALTSYLLLWLVTGKLPQPVLSMRMQRLRKHCRQLWISTSNIKMCLKCLRLPPFLAADLQR